MLFSEPKIPQSIDRIRKSSQRISFSALLRAENSSMSRYARTPAVAACFSALQRAENSSMFLVLFPDPDFVPVSVLFSEPKIPQCWSTLSGRDCVQRFSALQRAENSSIILRVRVGTDVDVFQCSSASRKFLNRA